MVSGAVFLPGAIISSREKLLSLLKVSEAQWQRAKPMQTSLHGLIT